MVTNTTQFRSPLKLDMGTLPEEAKRQLRAVIKLNEIVKTQERLHPNETLYITNSKTGISTGRSASQWKNVISANLKSLQEKYGHNGNGDGKNIENANPVETRNYSETERKRLWERLVGKPRTGVAIKEEPAVFQPLEVRKDIDYPRESIVEQEKEVEIEKTSEVLDEEKVYQTFLQVPQIVRGKKLDSLLKQETGSLDKLFLKKKASLEGSLRYLDESLQNILDVISDASIIFGRDYVSAKRREILSEVSLDKKYQIPKSFLVSGEKINPQENANALGQLESYFEAISVYLLHDIKDKRIVPSQLETAVQVLEDTDKILKVLAEKSKENKRLNEKEWIKRNPNKSVRYSLDYFKKLLSLKTMHYIGAFKKAKEAGILESKPIDKICLSYGLFPDVEFVQKNVLSEIENENPYQRHVQVLRKPLARSVSRARDQDEAEKYLQLRGSLSNIRDGLGELMDKGASSVRNVPSIMSLLSSKGISSVMNIVSPGSYNGVVNNMRFQYDENPIKRVSYPLKNFFVEVRDLSERVGSMNQRINYKDLDKESPFYRGLVKETLLFKEDFKEVVKKCNGLWTYGLWFGNRRFKEKSITEFLKEVMGNCREIENTFYMR